MKRKILAIIIIFCILTLAQVVSAGEIIFSTENSVYYADPGEDAGIQVDVRNTFSEDVMGSFTYTVCDQNDNTKTRSFTDTRNIFSDLEHIRFNVKQSSGQDYLIDISFDYFEKDDHSTAYHVKLDGIQIHFRDDASTLRRDTDSIPLSSVQIKMTTPEERQPESQHDNTETRQPDSVPEIKHSQDDTESLSGILEEDMLELREKKEILIKDVRAARTYKEMNDLFAPAGYRPFDLGVTISKGNYHDQFSLNLVNNESPEIRVSGEIISGEIPYITAESEGMIQMGDALTTNKTYQSLSSQLRDENFIVTGSRLNLSAEERSLNIIYEKGITKKEINATIRDNRVISIDLIESDSGVHYIIPILIIAITLISAIIFYTGYRKYADHFRDIPDTDEIPITEEYAETPVTLLSKSHTDYINNELKEAFSKAGQAARLHISEKYRDNENLTNSQTLRILTDNNDPDYKEYAEVIAACDRVVYAGNAMDAEKYINTYNLLKKIFEKKR